jgi:hypothetical protein
MTGKIVKKPQKRCGVTAAARVTAAASVTPAARMSSNFRLAVLVCSLTIIDPHTQARKKRISMPYCCNKVFCVVNYADFFSRR